MDTRRSKKRNIPLMALILFISALMSYYFLLHVPENEKSLRTQGIRRVGMIANNIHLKHKHYQEAVDVSPREYFLKWYLTTYPSAAAVYVSFQKDCVLYSSKPRSDYQTIGREQGRFFFMDPFLKPENIKAKKNPEVWETQTGNHHFVFSFGTYRTFDMDSLDKKPVRNIQPHFWGYIPGFMSSLERDDFFEDLFLVPTAGDVRGNIKANDLLNVSRLKIRKYQVPDSVIHKGPVVYEQFISGESYYVFHQRVKVTRELEFSLVGLVSKSKLTNEARAVPAWFLIFCTIGLLLLLQSWPMLKIFLLNKQEKLNSIDVNLAVTAFVFSIAVISILAVGFFSFLGPQRSMIDNRLSDLSKEIHAQFNADVQQRAELLRSKPWLFEPGSSPTNVDRVGLTLQKAAGTTKLQFNEIFNVDIADESYGRVRQLRIDHDRYYPDFFDTGISVASRAYFTQVATAIKNKLTIKPYVQSIKSRSSGQTECAISIPFVAGDRKEVRVITSPLPSVINPVLPSNYTFAVIDGNGMIQFHSDATKIQNELFFDECDDKNTLKSFIQHSAQGHLNITYNQKDYRAHFRKLYPGLYVITLYDLNQTRGFISDVFTLSLITVLFLVFYLGVLHMLFKLDVQKFQFVKATSFFYRWLNPFQIDGTTLNKLILFNFALAFFQVTWLLVFHSVVGSVGFVLLSVTMSCYINYTLLRDEGRDERHNTCFKYLAWFKTISMLLMIVYTLVLVSTAAGDVIPVVILLIFLWAFFAIAINHALISRSLNLAVTDPAREKAITLSALGAPLKSRVLLNLMHRLDLGPATLFPTYCKYRIFLFTWIMVIAVWPSLIFFKDHFHFESILRAKEHLYHEAMKLQVTTGQPQFTGYDYGAVLQPIAADNTFVPFHDPVNHAFYDLMPLYWNYKKVALLGSSELDLSEDRSIKTSGTFDFSYNPDAGHVQVSMRAASDQLEVPAGSSETSKDSKPAFIERAEILSPLLGNGTAAAYMMLAFAVAAGMLILWIACYRVPARIFFMPLFYLHIAGPEDRGPGELTAAASGETEEDALVKFLKTTGLTPKQIGNPNLSNAIIEQGLMERELAHREQYQKLWEGCSAEEQHALLDLAEDGIANLGNKTVLDNLAAKGLIRIYPCIEIREISFANFVLKAVTYEDREKMEEKAKQEGGWHNWRLPLIILVISLLGFLSLVEEGLVARVSAVLASVALLLPNVVNIGASIGRLFSHKQAA